MCGRYALMSSVELLVELFNLSAGMEAGRALSPRFNIAPTQLAPVIRPGDAGGGDHGGRRLDPLKWGLIPSWSKDAAVGARLINARSETVATKPSFRESFARRRCLVPADGFFEWKAIRRIKQPYWIHRADGRPYAMAGVWDRWVDRDGEVVESFAILTREANDVLRPLHDRMPVILDPAVFERWLDPDGSPEDHGAIIDAADGAGLVAHPVSRRVNSPKHDDVTCIERVEVDETGVEIEEREGWLF